MHKFQSKIKIFETIIVTRREINNCVHSALKLTFRRFREDKGDVLGTTEPLEGIEPSIKCLFGGFHQFPTVVINSHIKTTFIEMSGTQIFPVNSLFGQTKSTSAVKFRLILGVKTYHLHE